MRVATVLLCLQLASYSCCADEPHELARHFIMIRGTTEPQGLSRCFPAVAIKSEGDSTILATASWGGELFPIPPDGRKVDRFHVLDSEQNVELISCDEQRGVSLFRISSSVPPWPADHVFADSLAAGDELQWLRLNNRKYRSGSPRTTSVKEINTKLPYKTPQGRNVVVNSTLTFGGRAGGPPGTFLIRDGKLAAVWLNNDASDRFAHHALTGPAFMAGVQHLLAESEQASDSVR